MLVLKQIGNANFAGVIFGKRYDVIPESPIKIDRLYPRKNYMVGVGCKK